MGCPYCGSKFRIKDTEEFAMLLRTALAEERPETPELQDEGLRQPGPAPGPEPTSALARQEGGDHYKKLKIQPMEYSMANDLDACQHTIIKYVTRFRDKGGIADLRKAIHTIEMLIEMEERNKVT